jgi:hypothetical protein
MWLVLYDDGMSLTTASEQFARSLAEAERQRGRRVTVRPLDDAETHLRGAGKPAAPPGRARGDGPVRPGGTDKPSAPGSSRAVGGSSRAVGGAGKPPGSLKPTHPPEQPESVPASEPASGGRPPEPVPAAELTQVLGPTQAVEPTQAAAPPSVPEPAGEASPPEPTREPEPARVPRPARRRRLLLYALAAASIVVAAALVDHWDVLPRVGANTGSSPTQVGGPPQLLPPLDQPPVMHFSNAVNAMSTPAEPSAPPTSPAADLPGTQNLATRPTGSPTSAESPQSAMDESSGGGPSTIARGG